MLLTVELVDEYTVAICGDEQGLAHLIQRLEVIKERGGHEHLMSPAWVGGSCLIKPKALVAR